MRSRITGGESAGGCSRTAPATQATRACIISDRDYKKRLNLGRARGRNIDEGERWPSRWAGHIKRRKFNQTKQKIPFSPQQ